MRRHIVNAACGVVDYASYPIAMLFAGPFVLGRLGAAEFGLWMIAAAVISSGGIVASGFSEANLQRVSRMLPKEDTKAVLRTVRSMMAINIVTGSIVALAVLVAVPWLAIRIEAGRPSSLEECIVCLRLAAGCILLRSIHAVAVSTQRAFQDYRASVRITSATHLATLGAAALLATMGRGPISILIATAAILLLATLAQCHEAARLLGVRSILPGVDREAASALLSGGVFAWLQTVGGVLAERVDRLLLGASLGAAAVVPYVLCVQLAQPLAGLTGSGLSFLMPHLSGLAARETPATLRRTILRVLGVNLIIVLLGVTLAMLAGTRVLAHWAGPVGTPMALRLFPRIVAGSALLACSVTGIYALQALGKFRVLAGVSLGSRLAMFPVMLWQLDHAGMSGLASFRLYAGALSFAVYVPLLRMLWPPSQVSRARQPLEPRVEEALL